MIPNEAAKNEAASDFSVDYAAATLTLFSAGNAALAVHTLAGFGAPSNGVITASAIASATATAAAGAGTDATYAELTAGTKTYTLTVGTSATEVVMSPSVSLVQNGTSNITNLTVTF